MKRVRLFLTVAILISVLCGACSGSDQEVPEKCEPRHGWKTMPDGTKVKHGDWWACYEHGQWKSRSQYYDDKLNGKHIEWYSNGNERREYEYREGKLHGRAAEWYWEGTRKLVGSYRDGKAHGDFTWWHANGKKGQEWEQQDGAMHAKHTTWYSNGRKRFQGQWRNNKQCGTWSCWDEGGSATSCEWCEANPTGASCPPCGPL